MTTTFFSVPSSLCDSCLPAPAPAPAAVTLSLRGCSMASFLSSPVCLRSSHLLFSYCGCRLALRWFELDGRFGNVKKARHGGRYPLSTVSPTICCQKKRDLFADPNLKILKLARDDFAQEISFSSDDKEISLPKALLLIAVEDEALIAFNRDKDTCSFMNERKDVSVPVIVQSDVDSVENILLSGKSISGWLSELDMIAKEVESELISRDIGCHLVEVLEAVNFVLFKIKGFKRLPVSVDSKFSYLHTVLNTGYGSDILISIIYIEICRRLGIAIVGSRVGENFLIWPKTNNLQELFRVFSGHSLFATINGKCVENPKTMAFELDSTSLLGLDVTTNRDIISIALANLTRLYWKRASRANRGLMLTSPLGPVHPKISRPSMSDNLQVPLLRPQDLRLAIMASERLLILQPHSWTIRRDHGMLLYYSRRYAEAVQELSICMAFAPEDEAEKLEPFVEKLHLLRLVSSWESLEPTGSVPVP